MSHSDDLDEELDLRYGTGYELGYKGLPITEAAKQDPCAVEGYLSGISNHITELYIAEKIEDMEVKQETFYRAEKLQQEAVQIKENLAVKNITVQTAIKERELAVAEQTKLQPVATAPKNLSRKRLRM